MTTNSPRTTLTQSYTPTCQGDMRKNQLLKLSIIFIYLGIKNYFVLLNNHIFKSLGVYNVLIISVFRGYCYR